MNVTFAGSDRVHVKCNFCGTTFEYPLPIRQENLEKNLLQAIIGAHRHGHNFGKHRPIEIPKCSEEWLPGTYKINVAMASDMANEFTLSVDGDGLLRVIGE